MSPESLEVRRFGPENRGDFFRVHAAERGCGACSCVAWWTPTWEGWGGRTAEENRALRETLLSRGEYDGYLLYAAGEPVGWCQAGPRDRLQKLVRQFELPPDPGTWAITCFLVVPAFRRRGLAATLLRAVLADLLSRGARRVEVFPKRGPGLDAMDLWNGPEGMYLRAGFRVARDDPKRPVLVREG